jgi:hypothetical protein
VATIDVKDASGSTVAIEKPLAPGRSAAATSRPVAMSTEDKAVLDTIATQTTLVGSVTESAPASDTASSGLNGRLQRIAQRLTSLIGLLPTALGAGGGLKVDGSGTPLPITDAGGSITVDGAVNTIITGQTGTVAVAGTFFQATQPVSASALPLPAGASTEATLAALNAKVTAGAATETTLSAQSAKLPATLGQKAMTASMAVVLASDQSAIQVNAAELGGTVTYNGATLPVKRAILDASASGSTQIVSLVAGRKLVVLSYELVANGAVNIQFRSNATQISSTKYANAAGWGVARANNPHGYFETAAGETLNINLSAAIAVGIQINYIEA